MTTGFEIHTRALQCTVIIHELDAMPHIGAFLHEHFFSKTGVNREEVLWDGVVRRNMKREPFFRVIALLEYKMARVITVQLLKRAGMMAT